MNQTTDQPRPITVEAIKNQKHPRHIEQYWDTLDNIGDKKINYKSKKNKKE